MEELEKVDIEGGIIKVGDSVFLKDPGIALRDNNDLNERLTAIRNVIGEGPFVIEAITGQVGVDSVIDGVNFNFTDGDGHRRIFGVEFFWTP